MSLIVASTTTEPGVTALMCLFAIIFGKVGLTPYIAQNAKVPIRNPQLCTHAGSDVRHMRLLSDHGPRCRQQITEQPIVRIVMIYVSLWQFEIAAKIDIAPAFSEEPPKEPDSSRAKSSGSQLSR